MIGSKLYSLQVVKLSVEPRSDALIYVLFFLTLSGQKIFPKKNKMALKLLNWVWQHCGKKSLGSSRNYDEISETGLICHTMITLRRNLKINVDIS